MNPTISIAEFRKQCPTLFQAVWKKGKSFVITKRGQQIAKIVPIPKKAQKKTPKFGCMKGTIFIPPDTDLTAPIDVEWDAAS